MSSLLEIVPGTAVGVGVGGAVSAVIGPRLQGLTNSQWADNQNLPLDAATAAAASAEGLSGQGTGAGEASLTGVNSARFATLVELAQTAPDTGTLLTLWRRGLIGEGSVKTGFHKARLLSEYWGALEGLKDVLLSPQDLAMARQQRFIDAGRQHSESALQGVNGERADILYEMSGLPPGIEQALTLWRRKIIDQATFEQIVAEGHTKTKYTGALEGLKRTLLSPSEAASAVVKEHLTFNEGLAIAEQWGLEQSDFNVMYLTSGRPPGPMQMLTLVNRGFATEADFKKALALSDVRTEYAPMLFHLRAHYPSLFQMRQLVQSGAIDDATAIQWLQNGGYLADVGPKLVAAWKKPSAAATKGLSMSVIETMYEGRYISAGSASALLKKLGYDDNDISMILQLGDARRVRSFLQTAVGKIHSLYISHRITDQEAITSLDSLGISAESRGDLMAFWQHERAVNLPGLTPTQIGKAVAHNLMTQAEGLSELTGRGFSSRDAQIIIDLA